MLECGKNFKGTLPEICQICNTQDDENHRLNECIKWKDTNNVNRVNKAEFQNIFSDNDVLLNQSIAEVENIWELKYANGRMKRPR